MVVTALQAIASRRVSPNDSAVVSVTQIHAGDTWNVLPQDVVLRGTARAFNRETRDRVESDIERIVVGMDGSPGARAALTWALDFASPEAVVVVVGLVIAVVAMSGNDDKPSSTDPETPSTAGTGTPTAPPAGATLLEPFSGYADVSAVQSKIDEREQVQPQRDLRERFIRVALSVSALAIIETLDVVEYISPRIISSAVFASPRAFTF